MAKVARTKVLKGAVFVVVLGLAGGAVVNTFGASAITYEGSANVGFEITDSINLSVSGDITIPELVPGNSADSNVVNITVSTNASSGYTLSAKMATASSDLTASGISGGFTSVDASGSGVSSLTSGKWGYKVLTGSGGVWSDYLGLPVSSSDAKILADTDTMPSGGSAVTQFKIGANAGSSMSAGAYTNSITFYAVAKVPPVIFGGITNMQQMTSSICSNASENDTKQLIDTRDSKTYWVTKLADGNCWMTQNLDYDLVSGTTLTSSDSDVESSWQINASTYTATGTWNGSYDASESYDPGNNYIPSGTGSATSAASLASDSTDLHYHQGNYYNWYAATAGSNASNMNNDDEAPQSICPAGWRLPYSGYTQVGSKSWYYLVNQASITESNITTGPFYIPRAGGYNKSVNLVGSSGFYWSSTANGNGYADLLVFYSSGVYPQGSNDAGSGYSVRCVAQ